MSQLRDVALAAIRQQERLSDIVHDALIRLAKHDIQAAAWLVGKYREAVDSNAADFQIIESGAGIPRE